MSTPIQHVAPREQAVRFMNHIRIRTFSFVLVLIGVSILLPARLRGGHVYGAATT